MIKEHYSILFCSLTGNTKKLADAIYETLPKDKCDYLAQTIRRYRNPTYAISDFGRTKGMRIKRH